jgi:TrmH family RNA methyltransferase
MSLITSRQHPVVKRFRAVARGDRTAALVDGWHLIAEARRASLDIEVVAIAGDPPDRAMAHLVRDLAGFTQVVSVSTDVMHAISPVRSPSGVAALVRRRTAAVGATLAPAPALVLVAVDLQDPGNGGALIRAAEAGGATGAIFCGASVDPWGWKALRAAMGSTFRLPVAREPDAAAVVAALQRGSLRVAATIPRGGAPMHDVDFADGVALLVGGEGEGLSAMLVDAADLTISIPMSGHVESLNVAVAAAVLIYEARRQRAVDASAPAIARRRRS